MSSLFLWACVLPAFDSPPPPVAWGLDHPIAALGFNGSAYVLGQHAVSRIDKGKAEPVASGLAEPRAFAAHFQWLFVAEKDRVLRIGFNGKKDVLAEAAAFPAPPGDLAAIAVEPQFGTIFVADGDERRPAVFRISPQGKVATVTDRAKFPELRKPTGLAMDGTGHLLLLDGGAGTLFRIKLKDGAVETVATGLEAAAGLVWDPFGRLFVGDGKNSRLLVMARPNGAFVPMPGNHRSVAGFGLAPSGTDLLLPDAQAGMVTAVAITVPGAEVDQRPLPLETELAFPNLKWAGWSPERDDGRPNPLRPVVLTHAGDGTNRVFVGTQRGVVHVFANDQAATETKVFLDIQDRVYFDERWQDEGFCGLCFHPKFKQNREFFVFYCTSKAPSTVVLSRFRARADDPSTSDPASEETLLTIKKSTPIHNGGTLCFGPDGYLYVAVGDGGPPGDAHQHGQNLQSLRGKVLRLDVDRKAEGKPYAVPADNPFVGRADVLPEIWAYGLRVVWRMAFDRATGQLWAADVGQDHYEEIDLLKAGGNYGWSRREGRHPFGPDGAASRPEFVEPIWEYNRHIGICIIGGSVYRGPRLPELQGYYVYAEYTNTKLWGLKYDPAAGRVVENRPIKVGSKAAIWSFGEDERGEVYLLSLGGDGRGIFRFARSPAAKP